MLPTHLANCLASVGDTHGIGQSGVVPTVETALAAGLGGATRHGCVALSDGERLVAVCEQERVTRDRGAGFNVSGLPDEALDTLLERLGHSRASVRRYVLAEGGLGHETSDEFELVDHHFAHACTSYLSSPFTSGLVLVCDHEAPRLSIWEGRGPRVSPVAWPWNGPGFADVYSRCARAFGFSSAAGDQRFEALARLSPQSHDDRIAPLLTGDGTSLTVHPDFESVIEQALAPERIIGGPVSAGLAAAVQARLSELFVDLLREIGRQVGGNRLCLAGSFFYHSSINTAVKQAGVFEDVFVPIDPGNGGLAVGTALHAAGGGPRAVSPFLGPAYPLVPDEGDA